MSLKDISNELQDPYSDFWNLYLYIQNTIIYELCRLFTGVLYNEY